MDGRAQRRSNQTDLSSHQTMRRQEQTICRENNEMIAHLMTWTEIIAPCTYYDEMKNVFLRREENKFLSEWFLLRITSISPLYHFCITSVSPLGNISILVSSWHVVMESSHVQVIWSEKNV